MAQYKKSQESKFVQGSKRYDRKQQGFGDQSKPKNGVKNNFFVSHFCGFYSSWVGN